MKKNLILGIFMLFLTALPIMHYLSVSKVFFGLIFLTIFPGFFVYLLFFPVNKLDFKILCKISFLDLMERIGLSFTLSLIILTVISFYFNAFGLKITMLSVCTLMFLTSAAAIIFNKKLY